MTLHDRLRALPAVGDLLEAGRSLADEYGHTATVDVLRTILDEARTALRCGESPDIDQTHLIEQARQRLRSQFEASLRPVINATGVIIHTNLGRAPLSEDALEAVQQVAGAYNTLEFDLDAGGRGSRNLHPEPLLTQLTGAQAALVVNNAASALVLALGALATGREVVVSRGQLVEIGGGFRIPEIMSQSGAQLREVGTTNKTRPQDYRQAVRAETAALLRVHVSNFVQMGFTETVNISQMATVAQETGVWLIDDVGSGALLNPSQFGLKAEPLVQDSVSAGADLVIFSGDKLLGGPQAGVIVGKAEAVQQLRRHPLARALRADKMTLAALVVTLAHYRRGEALEKVPVWWMMARPAEEIRRTAARWAARLPHASVAEGHSTVGGGSVPGSALPTSLVALAVANPTDVAQQLRTGSPAVIARIQDGRVLLDPRTVFPAQEEALLARVADVIG